MCLVIANKRGQRQGRRQDGSSRQALFSLRDLFLTYLIPSFF